ncbi:MAG: hypothetical protein MJ195_02435 [Mycoplasmoidaceae bacterium]|nr:hypothetical protein [Mycoplasmoidaceae bacterium]
MTVTNQNGTSNIAYDLTCVDFPLEIAYSTRGCWLFKLPDEESELFPLSPEATIKGSYTYDGYERTANFNKDNYKDDLEFFYDCVTPFTISQKINSLSDFKYY